MADIKGREVPAASTAGLAADSTTLGRVSWALYDWANSPFTTLIITFVFSAYFARGVVGDEIQGQSLWGYTAAISGAVIAIFSPIFGSIADAGGPRKPWLLVFTLICVGGSYMLWYVEPDPAFIVQAMFWVIIANIAFEFGIVFNNAMLPDIVAEERIGRWSGWAWGVGYFGGLAALVLALYGFVQTETPLFGIGKENAANIRVVGPIVAIWFVLFVWPMFAFTPDRVRNQLSTAEKISNGLGALIGTLKKVRHYRNIALFLIARMIYADGLATVFVVGGVYAAGAFHMEFADVIKFGILLNVTAGIGAFCFAWVDDWIGSKPTIIISLIGLIATALVAILARDVMWFWVAGALLGIFVGPAQAASRSMLARMAPAELSTEFFGLFALTGKATAFLGPLLVGIFTTAFESQRIGLSVVLAFFFVGLLLLLPVKEERATAALD
jgi:UMF1 family MFS transporter